MLPGRAGRGPTTLTVVVEINPEGWHNKGYKLRAEFFAGVPIGATEYR